MEEPHFLRSQIKWEIQNGGTSFILEISDQTGNSNCLGSIGKFKMEEPHSPLTIDDSPPGTIAQKKGYGNDFI
jgi:hypothetical protein